MSFLDTAFQETLGISWRVGCLILALVVVHRLLARQLSSAAMFLAWCVVALLLLVPLRIPVAWNPYAWTHIQRHAPSPKFTPFPPVAISTVAPLLSRSDPALPAAEPEVEPVEFSVAGQNVAVEQTFVRRCAEAWLLGVLLLLAGRVVAIVRLRRLLGRAVPWRDERVLYAARRGATVMNLRRFPRLVAVDAASMPALCGIVRPHLLFPAGLADKLSDSELDFVMLHELGHLRRRDLAAHFFLQLAAIVHWFNPLVWIALRYARLDCEHACDELVLQCRAEQERGEYGHVLLKVVGETRAPLLPASVGIAEGKRQLQQRLRMIMARRPQNFWRLATGVVLIAAVAAVGFTHAVAEESVTVKNGVTPQPKDASFQGTVAVPDTGVVQASPSGVPSALLPRQAIYVVGGQQTYPLSPSQLATRIDGTRDAEPREKMKRIEGEREERLKNATIELRSIGRVGGVDVAIVDIENQPHVAVEGGAFESYYSVEKVDSFAKEVIVRFRNEEPRALKLIHPRPAEYPVIPPELKKYLMSEKHQDDEATRRAEMLPGPVVFSWSSINPEARDKILLNYLREGRVVNVGMWDTGSTSSGSLFAREIAQARHERQEAFVATLSTEQKEWYVGTAQPAVDFRAAKRDPEGTRSKIAARQANVAENTMKLEASLTPKQRELYTAIYGRSVASKRSAVQPSTTSQPALKTVIEDAPPELRALGTVGGVPVAVADVAGEPRVGRVGERFALHCKVTKIDVEHGTVTVEDESKRERVLVLTHPRAVIFPKIDDATKEQMIGDLARGADPEHGRKEIEVIRKQIEDWDAKDVVAKQDALLALLAKGFVVTVHEHGSGFNAGDFFATEASARKRSKLADFMISLSREQQEWFENSRMPLVRFADAAKDPVGMQRNLDQARLQAEKNKRKLLESLSPESRKLYDEMGGF